jgi:EAL domain-containing protein (putative c-di-GMP-specific phosphodiesterase class I)
MDILKKFAAAKTEQAAPASLGGQTDLDLQADLLAQVESEHAELAFHTLDLKRALHRKEFLVYYQPRVDLIDGEVVAMKALLRWDHPHRGVLSAETFLPLAERAGMMAPIGQWMIECVLDDLQQMTAIGLRKLPVTIPLSRRQLQDPMFASKVSKLVTDRGFDASSLCFELPAGLGDIAASSLRVLHWLGISYSLANQALEHSTHWADSNNVEISSIKVNRHMLRDAAKVQEDADDVREIIEQAHLVHRKVIAEGAETPEQVRFLQEQGCDQVQGFYFRPAVCFEEMCELLFDDVRMSV